MADAGPSPGQSPAAGASLAVEIVRREPAWTRAQTTDALLRRAARAALGAAPHLPGEAYRVTLVLTGDEEMRELNRVWRGQDKATNVLSFPADVIRDRGFLGDLVLARETACKEADERGITLSNHVSHLVVHGMLHLLGFDHAEDEDADRMETLERAALASIDVADPYAEAGEARHAETSS
jgi:probable rRNA maturation factor